MSTSRFAGRLRPWLFALVVLAATRPAGPVVAQPGPNGGEPPGQASRCQAPPGEARGQAERRRDCRGFSGAGGMADFNRDGFTDLAIGTPNGNGGLGEVNVIFGSAAGLSATGNLLLSGPASPDQTGGRGQFGFALAAGDFDNDGFADLAVGAPSAESSRAANLGRADTGLVHIFRGPALTPAAVLAVGESVVPGTIVSGERFGQTLAVGNFNGDAFADLAVGMPFSDGAGSRDSGVVVVLYGSATGLGGAGAPTSQLWSQATSGVSGNPERDNGFGSALAAGDFDGDRRDDLAIGVPFETTTGVLSSNGAVQVLYGSASGLTAERDQFWTQSSIGIPGVAQANDFFGSALAAGDFNGDGKADLAIGVIGENVFTGVVHVLYGRSGGLSASGTQLWSQDTAGVTGTAEREDQFGAALAAADFNGDGKADLAIGIPFKTVGGRLNAGAVLVLYGKAEGLHEDFDQLWTLDVAGIIGAPNDGDLFGSALAWGDFNGDKRADLAIGVEFGDGAVVDSGTVHVLYGSATLLTATGNQRWGQGLDGIQGTPERLERFGHAVH